MENIMQNTQKKKKKFGKLHLEETKELFLT